MAEFEHYGFTGTRKGMTGNQKLRLDEFVKELRGCVWHHGCCIGADAESHRIARVRGLSLHGHPPIQKHMMAEGLEYDALHGEAHFLARDRILVDVTALLFAAPESFRQLNRNGGTWYTRSYALHIGRPVITIYPDGTYTREQNEPVQAAFRWS